MSITIFHIEKEGTGKAVCRARIDGLYSHLSVSRFSSNCECCKEKAGKFEIGIHKYKNQKPKNIY